MNDKRYTVCWRMVFLLIFGGLWANWGCAGMQTNRPPDDGGGKAEQRYASASSYESKARDEQAKGNKESALSHYKMAAEYYELAMGEYQEKIAGKGDTQVESLGNMATSAFGEAIFAAGQRYQQNQQYRQLGQIAALQAASKGKTSSFGKDGIFYRQQTLPDQQSISTDDPELKRYAEKAIKSQESYDRVQKIIQCLTISDPSNIASCK